MPKLSVARLSLAVSLCACSTPSAGEPDPALFEDAAFTALLDPRTTSEGPVAFCLLVRSRGMTLDPAPRVLTSLTRRSIPALPASQCAEALGYDGARWDSGGLHDTVVVELVLPPITTSPRLDLRYQVLLGPHAGDAGVCEFSRKRGQWRLDECILGIIY